MDGIGENPHAAATMNVEVPRREPAVPPHGHATDAAAATRREAHNTFWLECYQVVVRVGWIFKTETIIMPAILDAVVDSGLLRGILPILNRGGQSLPPLVFAGPLARRPVKKWTLVATTLGMAVCFAVLAVAWGPLAARRAELLAALFLAVYAVFSTANGLTQLVSATLTGKLIPAGRRGRAMVASVTVGSGLAIAAAIWLLGPWLRRADWFVPVFGVTAAFFAVAAVVPAWLDEPPDEIRERAASGFGLRLFGDFGRTLRADPALVRLAVVAACFSAVLMLFPHYQAFARDRLGSPIGSLLTWVVVQNAATALASIVAGPVADRRGTRIVLIWVVALSSLTPLVVSAFSLMPRAAAGFWVVYALLGLNPVSLRMFTNYALELAPGPDEHAKYVSIVGAALAAPFVLSPLAGLAIDALGFRPVFVVGALAIAAGAVIAIRLPEPRRHRGG
jgi:predicted MFS family arabinose efflux permease